MKTTKREISTSNLLHPHSSSTASPFRSGLFAYSSGSRSVAAGGSWWFARRSLWNC